MEIAIRVSYDGLDANSHQLDMRLFGRALIGLDRALSVGLVSLATGRIPESREKLPLVVKASAPQAGCVDFMAIVAMAPQLLPFLIQAFDKHGPQIAWLLLSAMLKRLGGKPKQADDHVTELLGTMNKLLDDRQLERRFVLDVMDRMQSSAV